MISEKVILDQLDFHAMDALNSIVDGESSPKTCIDLLDAALEHESFCNAIGVKTPLKYSKVLYKVRDLFLIVHPELMERCSSLWNDNLEDTEPDKEKQAWAGSMIRLALGSVYGIKIDGSNDHLPASDSVEAMLDLDDGEDDLDEAIEFMRLFSVDD
jgi:hypothetical protein